MQTYIVRQPILDRNQNVVGYEVLYKESFEDASALRETKAANAIENFLETFDSESFLDGKTAYLTFTPNLLMRNVPRIFAEQKLVIQIDDSSIVHPVASKIIYRYKKQGYRLAAKGFAFGARYFSILDAIDIIKIDFANPDSHAVKNIIQIATNFEKEIIAYNINTPQTYAMAMELGCHYLQGAYVAQASTTEIHRMDHMQSNFFQLVVAITKDEPDIDEITAIISRDVTLAFSLIKLVNSAYFSLRNQVKSVKQALIVLGLGQLKQWIYLLSFKPDNDALPNEVIKMSFLRASFCSELVTYLSNFPISRPEAYLMGMFSTLGVLLEVPLEAALAELAVSSEVKQALLTGEGPCGLLYNLVLAYEAADWQRMAGYAEKLGLKPNLISQAYFECVEQVNGIWHSLTMPYGQAEAALAAEQAEPVTAS